MALFPRYSTVICHRFDSGMHAYQFFCNSLYYNFFLLFVSVEFVAHAVLDVVVDDEVKLFLRKAVMLRLHLVDFIDDGLGEIYFK